MEVCILHLGDCFLVPVHGVVMFDFTCGEKNRLNNVVIIGSTVSGAIGYCSAHGTEISSMTFHILQTILASHSTEYSCITCSYPPPSIPISLVHPDLVYSTYSKHFTLADHLHLDTLLQLYPNPNHLPLILPPVELLATRIAWLPL